jgi:site-specific recombinase
MDLKQSLCLLGSHVAGVGLAPEFRERCRPYLVEESPFYRVQRFAGELVRANSPEEVRILLENLRTEMIRCGMELEYIHEGMEVKGVSTALEFDVSMIRRALRRMDSIANALFDGHTQDFREVKRLLDDVMRARFDDLSISAVVRENAVLLARKIVERTGKTGEHYIADSRSEYWHMWKAAVGGGLLIVATAAVKISEPLATLLRGTTGGRGLCSHISSSAGVRPGSCDEATVDDCRDLRQNCSHDSGHGTLGEADRID